MLNHQPFIDNEHSHSYSRFHYITQQLNKIQNVQFALYCAKDTFPLISEEYNEQSKTCINLVESWLIDPNSVSSEQLNNASNAAWIASNAAWIASNAVSNASWSASNAAWTASNASYSASNASYSASNAAWTVASNAAWTAYYALRSYNNDPNKIYEYLTIANSFFTTNNNITIFPNYEFPGKILYLIDELNQNIILNHNNSFYLNMNGITNCLHLSSNSIQDLLNKLFDSEGVFWNFARNWLNLLYKG